VGPLNGGLFVCLGVSLLRQTELAPFSGWRMYVDAWQEWGRGGICCGREQPTGPTVWNFWWRWLYVCYWSYLLAVCRSLPDSSRVVVGWFPGRPSLTNAALLTH
jgi:hypothetical protein